MAGRALRLLSRCEPEVSLFEELPKHIVSVCEVVSLRKLMMLDLIEIEVEIERVCR